MLPEPILFSLEGSQEKIHHPTGTLTIKDNSGGIISQNLFEFKHEAFDLNCYGHLCLLIVVKWLF